MTKNKILSQKVLCDHKPNTKPTYVKLNRSVSGIVSFETTTNEKEQVSIKELRKIYG